MPSILLVDGHSLFGDGFLQMARALRPRRTLYLSGSAAHAIGLCATLALDLIVIDVGLPGDDGFALVKDISRDPRDCT